MRLKFSLLYLTTILIVFGGFALKAVAVSPSSILVNIIPQNPAPYEDTKITLTSYVSDLDSVSISWIINGKTVASGIGEKSFSTTAPAAGAETNIIARISLPDGSLDTNIIIKPSVMVLLWQADDSYVPPFYRGKALPTPDSEVKVVAMPEVRNSSGNVPAQNMTYNWKKDYTNNVDGSGYGKNFFIFINDYLKDSDNISVVASTVDQRSSSNASVDIGMTQPKILFYNNDSNMGTLWQNSLTDPHIVQGSEIVEAVPYFISPKEIQSPTLIWNWSINENSVNLPIFKKNLIPLAITSGTHGTSKLKLEIDNKDKIFQTANKEISINF